ncbi:MAG: ABC transporter substrate-binding protein [Clostridiales bacterium]|nr:ABC transporter substrate-binding protein [Clostridiales bacterium]
MKKFTKLMAMLLVLTMMLSLVACAGNEKPADTTAPATTEPAPTEEVTEPVDVYTGPDWEAISAMDYDEASDALYEYNLGEFNTYYQDAKSEVVDLDLRLAKMAIAEAKLMESGVFMPVYGNGGAYAMNRAVPRSATTTPWGLDEYRFYTTLVTNELIKSTDRDALTALWGESEDADAWFAAAKAYLADKGYTLTDTWNFFTSYEIATWDCIASSYTSDAYFIAPTYSPLLEYDAKDVQQPALAESVDVSDDGTVYTFHLRQGVKWVDQQGREIGEVTADDWVASMAHLIDNNDALGYLMTSSDGCGIKNYDAYLNGEVTDFAEVGVKAIDDYTLEYTLEAPFPAFLSMMGYGCFAPLNRAFYKAQGGTFSVDGDEYTSGNYGTSPANIAYCGAYLVKNFTEKNVTSYVANPAYWNAEAVNTPNMNMYYNDGSDTLRAYNEAKAGTVAGCSFNSSALVLAKEEKPEGADETYFDLYSYTTKNDATTYCGWVNVNRASFANFNDNTVGVSTKSEEEKVRTRDALSNQNFRLALAMAFDRGAFNATMVGEDLKFAALKNSYTPGTFQKTADEVTVDINGTATTFPAGTYFGVIEQAQLDADGVPLKVWDPEADAGAGSGDGFDGWFNADAAAAYLEKAVAELAQIGVEVSAEKPIHIDVPYGSFSESVTNRVNAYKQSIENVTGGKIIIDLVAFADQTSYTYAYYRNSNGAEANYDTAPGVSGWGPDYGDAQSYLDTIQPYGYMCKSIGLY